MFKETKDLFAGTDRECPEEGVVCLVTPVPPVSEVEIEVGGAGTACFGCPDPSAREMN